MEGMKEAAKKKIEEEMGEQAPGYIMCCYPCCGGPLAPLTSSDFVIPADKRDDVKAAIAKYKEM